MEIGLLVTFPKPLLIYNQLPILYLDSNNSTGNIPHVGNIPHAIGNLHFLCYLYLNSNNLTGKIPNGVSGFFSYRHKNNLEELFLRALTIAFLCSF